MIRISTERDKHGASLKMDYKIPKTMEKQHEELHAELRKATTILV